WSHMSANFSDSAMTDMRRTGIRSGIARLIGSWHDGAVDMQRLISIVLGCGFAASVNGATSLHAPPEFNVEKAAVEPEVRFQMFATFNDRGRLFVAESSGLDLYAELSAQTRACRIRMLEDADGDGVFERSTLFAQRLVFPMGLVWRDGRLYV